MPADAPLSATSLEWYARCPQRFMLERLLRVRAVEEPEQVVRIDALSRGSVIHRIFERFYDEWNGKGPAPLAAEAERRMRRIAGEECDAARDRGETGYPAMWEADRVELIEDCVRWLHEEREDELTRAAADGRGRGAVRAADGRREAGFAVAGGADRDRAALRARCVCTAGSTGSTGTRQRSRFRVVDYKTGKKYAESPGELQGGRMLQLPLYVLAAAKLLGIDPAAGGAAYVYPTRKGEFQTSSTGRPRSSPHVTTTCSRCSTRSSPPPGAGTSSSRRRTGRAISARSTGSASARAAATPSARTATSGSRRLATEIRGVP